MNPYEEELLEQEATQELLKANVVSGIQFLAFTTGILLGFGLLIYFVCNVSNMVQSYFS